LVVEDSIADIGVGLTEFAELAVEKQDTALDKVA